MKSFHVIDYNDKRINVDIDILTMCNYHCWYCYAREDKDLWNKVMKLNQVEIITKRLKELPYEIDIGILGGEPSLHPKLYEIVREFSKIPNIRDLVLFSNGTRTKLLEVLQKLQVNRDPRLKVNLSFHPTEIKDFEKFNDIVDKVYKMGFLWKITVMITKGQEDKINKFMKLKEKYPDVFFEQTYPVVHDEIEEFGADLDQELLRSFVVNEDEEHPLTYDEVVDRGLNRFKGWKCALRYFHINVDGTIHANCFESVGNIFKDNLPVDSCTCPLESCVHDCMLETLKTLND